jgi:hypothetical protein
MRILATVFLGVGLAALQGSGQLAYTRDDKAPSLKEAHLRLELRKKVDAALFACEYPSDCQSRDEKLETEKSTMVEPIRLGPGGKGGLLVWAGGRTLCGGTGNCALWIFDPATGGLLLESEGWILSVERALHAGRYDISVSMNGVGDTEFIYRFDGRRYRQFSKIDH